MTGIKMRKIFSILILISIFNSKFVLAAQNSIGLIEYSSDNLIKIYTNVKLNKNSVIKTQFLNAKGIIKCCKRFYYEDIFERIAADDSKLIGNFSGENNFIILYKFQILY